MIISATFLIQKWYNKSCHLYEPSRSHYKCRQPMHAITIVYHGTLWAFQVVNVDAFEPLNALARAVFFICFGGT